MAVRVHRKKSDPNDDPNHNRPLLLEEIRLISDLRIMHAKVDELFQVVSNLKRRHSGAEIHKYADQPVLKEDIERVDEIYLWFVNLKEQREKYAI